MPIGTLGGEEIHFDSDAPVHRGQSPRQAMVDVPRLAELLEPLYGAVLDPSLLDVFNCRLGELTGSPITGVLVHDVAAGRGQIARIHGVDSEHMLRLLSEVDLRDDPWMKRVTPQLATGRVLDSDAMLPRREALQSGFYDAYYRQLGIVQQVASVALYDGASSVTLSMCHGDLKRTYGERELGLLRAATPHWINAYAMLRRMDSLQRRVGSLEQALEQAPVAMFVLGEDLRICRSNTAAERLLERGLLVRRDGALAATGEGALGMQEMLQRALRLKSLLHDGDVEKRVLRGADHRPSLVLTAHRLVEWSQHERGALLVFARQMGAVDTSVASALQELFALTEAESRLALALYQHVDVATAAWACGIAPGTALGRLKTIYDKTGERGQASMVRLVAAVAGLCVG